MYIILAFKIPKLSLNMKSDENSDLWNFSFCGHQFLPCKYLDNIWEFIENSKKLSTSHIHVCKVNQVFLKKFTALKFFLISYLNTLMESLLSLFFRCWVFHDQNIVWNLRLPSKTTKLPCKGPGPTSMLKIWDSDRRAEWNEELHYRDVSIPIMLFLSWDYF